MHILDLQFTLNYIFQKQLKRKASDDNSEAIVKQLMKEQARPSSCIDLSDSNEESEDLDIKKELDEAREKIKGLETEVTELREYNHVLQKSEFIIKRTCY